METYEIPLVPGPTSVCPEVLAVYQRDYGSADMEPEFCQLYANTQAQLQQIMGTQNQMALISGEGMVALWGALKSALQPGDKVLAIATGVFGYGIGDMARAIGAEVEVVGFEYDEAATDMDRIEEAIKRFGPKMVTLVHCETPSGIMNPAAEVGALVRRYDVPLYYVDAVASMGGVPLHVDEWRIGGRGRSSKR
jgi:aspartate aminotransferase-like enzyme